MTNNPKRLAGIEGFGLSIVEVIPLVAAAPHVSATHLHVVGAPPK
jgi:GTP cyclohydrolase II